MQAAIESAGRLAERWSRVLRHPLGRQILPLGVGLWLAVDLVQVLGPLNFAAILNGVAAIEPQNWLGALVLTAVSFWAVSGYDVAVGHFLKINLPAKVLARSGAVATALAQLLGFGLVSGSLTRWRMLRCATVPLWRTSLLTGLVSLGFLCGVMVPVAVSVLLDGGLPEPARALAVFCLGVTILILILLMLRPGLADLPLHHGFVLVHVLSSGARSASRHHRRGRRPDRGHRHHRRSSHAVGEFAGDGRHACRRSLGRCRGQRAHRLSR